VKVEEGKYSIAEIVDWFKNKSLVVNSDYQRAGGLWPTSAKSYFIDTILKDFPFPKVYFHERVDKETKKPRREIVDGQQRITTIVDFVSGKFALGANSGAAKGLSFSQLSEEQQESFYSYTVAVDVIRNAEKSEILQMFRRMNAFTLPLNAPEKRHSQFFGEFKDWINTLLDENGRILIDWKIYTSRQVVRMADAEFMADVALAIQDGITSTSPQKLNALYKEFDVEFPHRAEWDGYIVSAIDAVLSDLAGLRNTYMTKAHIFHSLLCALMHKRYGLPGMEQATGITSDGQFFADRERALVSLRRLAAAHEEKDTSSFPEYVRAASEGGNRAQQRTERIKWLCRALQGEFAQ
jgi:hypothetical protein